MGHITQPVIDCFATLVTTVIRFWKNTDLLGNKGPVQ